MPDAQDDSQTQAEHATMDAWLDNELQIEPSTSDADSPAAADAEHQNGAATENWQHLIGFQVCIDP